MKTSRGGIATTVSLGISLVLLVAATWLYFNRQYAIDQLTVWQYEPSADVANLSETVGFTDKGRFYFYATQPVIDGTSKFNNECKRQEQASAILGCYTGQNIFIYNVTDKRLRGVKAVTAAHEMLHAAYQRLSPDEKKQINGWIEDEYKKIKDDDLEKRMAYYDRTEPGQKDNELHSIIATEFDNISPQLENYYKRYFKNRKQIVQLHTGYNSQFEALTTQRDDLMTTLNQLSAEIKKQTDAYNASIKTLNNDITVFNDQAKNGNFTNYDEFATRRQQLVDRSNKLTQDRDRINALMASYETKRVAYNKLVDEANSLQKSLDSSLAPPPSL